MPADTSAELSPNDSLFHSPASPLQVINPPPVNSISAPAVATPMSAPPAGQNPISPLANPESNPILTASTQLAGTGLNLELQLQRVIEREVQKAVAKAMSALLPTIAPNFTVLSLSSVASVNGTTNETVVIPRPYLTQNTITSRPSTVSSSTSNLVTKTTTKKSNNRSGLQCTCCGRKFHTADKCRILATLINAHKVTYKDGKYTSFYGKTTYKLENNQALIHTYPETFPKPVKDTPSGNYNAEARH